MKSKKESVKEIYRQFLRVYIARANYEELETILFCIEADPVDVERGNIRAKDLLDKYEL